jgi:hypothetical protein
MMTLRSMLLAAASAALLAACGPAATPAPKTDEEKIKMANEIAGLTADPKMFDGMFDSMTQQVKMATQGSAAMCAAQKDVARCQAVEAKVNAAAQAFTEETMEKAKAMVPELMTDMAAIMAQTYTGEELAKMHDFYESPEGKSIMMKQPQVMQQFMPAVMSKMAPFQQERAEALNERLAKARADAEAAAGPAPK